MAETVFFYLFSAVMLGAAVAVVGSRRPIYSVLSLLVAMLCLASLFVMLGAYFIAAIQVLVYAGAVLVLFLFVIMLLNLAPEALARTRMFTKRTVGLIAALWLLFQLGQLAIGAPGARQFFAVDPQGGTIESVGRLLFTAYLLPFELTSFLILAAIIGAVALAKQRTRR